MGTMIERVESVEDLYSKIGTRFEVDFTGNIQRFATNGNPRNKSGWVASHKIDNLEIVIAGDWSKYSGDEYFEYISKKRLSKEEKQRHKTLLSQTLERKRIEQQRTYTENIAMYNKELNDMKVNHNFSSFGYFKKKLIDSSYGGFFVKRNNQIQFVLPLKDQQGTITSYQFISEDGTKIFAKGCKVQGSYFEIGDTSRFAYICEGFATGVSIHLATGKAVIIAFNAGNLVNVARELKQRRSQFIIAADNDSATANNPGVTKAKEAANVLKCKVIYPNFTPEDKAKLGSVPTDYNDYYALYGKDATKALLESDDLDDDYQPFKTFFETHSFFNGFKVDLITGEPYIFNTGERAYENAWNRIRTIKSYARGLKLKAGPPLEEAFERFCSEHKKELLIDIQEWDGFDRISYLLGHVKCENLNQEQFIDLHKAWCAGIFKRLYQNGYQNNLLLWEGTQGIGKDTFFKNMFSGFEQYLIEISGASQLNDIYSQLAYSLVAGLPEFDQLKHIGSAGIKDMITSPGKVFRAPYDRKSKLNRFVASIYSSSNLSDYLTDTSGNRRFWVFLVTNIDWVYNQLIEDDKNFHNQVVAQCYELYKSGYQVNPSSVKAMSDFVEGTRTPEDMDKNMIEVIRDRFEELSSKMPTVKGLRYNDILPTLHEVSYIHKVGIKRLLSLIKQHGMSYEVGSANIRVYSHLPKNVLLN